MNDFVNRVGAHRARGTPVRNAVHAHWKDISDARAAGHSLNAIFRILKQDGKPVGKGYSSFRNAVAYWDRHAGPSLPAAPGPSPSPAPSPMSSGSFADDRFNSDF